MKVLVTVGTHEQPFQRLLDAVEATVPVRPADEWVVQYGVGRWALRSPRVLDATDYLDAPAMQDRLDWADVVVSQASPGTVFAALGAAAWPLVLGRRSSCSEHVDDHQVHFARELHRRGLVHDLVEGDRLGTALTAEATRTTTERRRRSLAAADRSAENAARFRRDVWTVLGAIS